MHSLLRVQVIVDDRRGPLELRSVHGLSLWIEYDNLYLLFDLGPSSEVLQHNADKLEVGIDLADSVVISHSHVDHFGGISHVGWTSPFLKAFVPYDAISSVGRLAKQHGLLPVEVIEWTSPWRGVHISKPIYGPPWEHFLVLETSEGLVVFSGCMHPGVEKSLGTIVEHLNDEVYGVIGGFHLASAPEGTVRSALELLVEKYRVSRVAPLHCSGDLLRELLRRKHPEKYIEAYAGSTIEVEA